MKGLKQSEEHLFQKNVQYAILRLCDFENI